MEQEQSIVDGVVERLEAAIFNGQFAPGERIREARVAIELGVSAGIVREALRRLEGRRVVIRNKNLGTSVAKLSALEVGQLLELREVLEVGACRIAAERMTDADLERLQAVLESHLLNQGNQRQNKFALHFSEWHNYDFHYQIALASGNQRLIELLCGDVWILMRAYRYPGALSPGKLPEGAGAHQEIMNALLRHDPEASERAMRSHLREFKAFVMHHLASDGASSARTRSQKVSK